MKNDPRKGRLIAILKVSIDMTVGSTQLQADEETNVGMVKEIH
jgi:hypothetical protein